jgi:ABC-type transporter Mla MlaB component
VQERVLEFRDRLTVANAREVLAQQQQSLGRIVADAQLAHCSVVADLSALVEVDTSALAVILQLHRDCRARVGRPLRIRGASQDLRSLARLSSLDSVLQWE